MKALIGNPQVKETLKLMLSRRRLPGALLFAGPSGVGKRLFGLELARAFNCHSTARGWGCGECAVCLRTGRFVLPPPDDKDEHKRIIWSEHADVGMVIPYNRNILVNAVRHLDEEAHFRPYEGTARFFLIEQADKLNEQSANALLKTLEEPPPTTHIVLLTDKPAALLPTILSRCQTIRFMPLTAPEIEDYLLRQGCAAPSDAKLLARLAEGSIGRALGLDVAAYRERRGLMLDVVRALSDTPDRARLLRVGEEMNDAKRKEFYESYLAILTGLVRDVWLLALGRPEESVVNTDIIGQLQPFSSRLPGRRLAGWLKAIAEHEQRLNVNINRKASTDALFLHLAGH